MFSILDYNQMTKKFHTQYHTCLIIVHYVAMTSEKLYSKMNGKTLGKKIKKSVQRT